jgi:hypothetical protein
MLFMNIFLCKIGVPKGNVLLSAFPLGIPVASKEITQRHRFFSHRGAGLMNEVCGRRK